MNGMETQRADAEPMEGDSVVILDEPKLREIVASGSLHFDDWTSLISAIDTTYTDDVEKISFVYDSFLAEFPLCYGYWRKYVAHKMRLCTVDAAIQVFERAVQSVTFSVDLWLDYCSFACSVFKEPSDVRRLFKRGLSFVGKDYLCHTLWDKYIEFEFSQKQWSCLAQIYIQTLKVPTKGLRRYYDRFKQLVEIWVTEMESYGSSNSELPIDHITETEISKSFKPDDISRIIKDLLDPSIGLTRFKALQKYKSIGEQSYQEASQLDEKIKCFENGIKRSYFHVKPLDDSQLENWHHYLDFAESHRDFDWAVKLYERCLIPCAVYPDFWMRYVEFMENKGAREIANSALTRATQTFPKKASLIHLFSARFKEHIRDATNAHAAFSQCDSPSDTKFVENVVMKANMERRLGNFIAASNIYKEALELAAENKEKCHILPELYIHFSRLKYMITGGEDAAIDILIDGVKHVPHSKLLIEELIKFAMTHGGSVHINVVDSIVANAMLLQQGVSQGLSQKDREDVSAQYLELVDLCGTVHDVRKAWNRHIRLFPHLVRTSFHPATGKKQWKLNVEAAQQTAATLHHQTSGECEFNCLIQSTSQDDKSSVPQNHDTGQHIEQISDQKLLENVLVSSGCVLDQKSPLVENYNSVNEVAVDMCLSGELDNSILENSHQVSPKVSETHRQDASEPNSLVLTPQVADKADVARTSLDYSEETDFQQENNQNSEQSLKPPSLERLALDPRVTKSPAPVSQKNDDIEAPAAKEREDFQERSLSTRSVLKRETSEDNSMSNLSMHEDCQDANIEGSISSPVRSQATDSSCFNSGNDNVSNSASNRKNKEWSPLQPQLENRVKNCNKKGSFDRFHTDSRHGSGGHSHKRLHHQRQHSPPKSDACERGSQVLHGQSYRSQPLSLQNSQARQDSQAQGQYPTNNAQPNLTLPQAWSMQNAQQQSPPVNQSQPPVHPTVSSQAQIFQYPLQSNEQNGNMQSNQAYNQMWQYYYYQQQLLWQQQHPQQQQLSQQQQLLQLQYLQQQHMQQQQSLHQPQQFQQFQHQQQEQQRLQLLQQLQGQQMQSNQQQQFLYLQKQQQQQHAQYHHHPQQMALSRQQKPELELGRPGQQINIMQNATAELDQQSAVPQGQVTLPASTGTNDAPATSNPQPQSLQDP